MGLFKKLFGTYSSRQIKKIKKLANKIEDLAPRFEAMSDEEMLGMTASFKQRLAAGETLDSLLPEAFALVREADSRVLGKRPFYVQLLGGILLHQGRIAEMKTGEGKTLVATMPAYLNALAGKGVHIVTVNDYLARRDSEEMGRVYAFLGLTTGLVVHGLTPAEKQAAYQADITYGTNNEFGFDYLRDNMALYREQCVQRDLFFAIVDEVDSILIDEARTPLIISGEGEESTDLYEQADRFVKKLTKTVVRELDDKKTQEQFTTDYVVDEKAKTATLTPTGIAKAEQFFKIDNLYDSEHSTLTHHINQALRAHGTMALDIDYVVKDDQVIIVDSFTGRLMPGRRYNEGLHQAIEAKEGVIVKKESKTMATIAFQNYFRMYKKLSGMTGTALTEDREFREIYALDVVEVPTNRPMIRKDHPDVVYTTKAGKYKAILDQIKVCHEKGQPVLVGTVSIEQSEFLSGVLKRNGIPHTVLNAKHHEKEAEIVAQAGRLGAVTISTNMAGRGTDIILGGNPNYMARLELLRAGYDEDAIYFATGNAESEDETLLAARDLFHTAKKKFQDQLAPEAEAVRKAGGLFILGTERHESRRIDNQLRGRSGRQGDPGESRFFLSLEDDLMRIFGGERTLALFNRIGADETMPISARVLSNLIETAQKRIESRNFSYRKSVITYDDVMDRQRDLIYKQRADVLNGADLSSSISDMIKGLIGDAVDTLLSGNDPEEWSFDELRGFFAGVLTDRGSFSYTQAERRSLTKDAIKASLCEKAEAIRAEKEKLYGSEIMREIERVILLQNVDRRWVDHLDAMEDLKDSVHLSSFAQRNPVNEYRIIGTEMFDDMINDIRERTVRTVLIAFPRQEPPVKRQAAFRVTSEGFEGAKSTPSKAGASRTFTPAKGQKPVPVTVKKVGRNELCPCGSGMKYKKCHGAAGVKQED